MSTRLALVAFLVFPSLAQARPLFVQGTIVNLREAPAADAPVVARVAIGTRCDAQGDKDGWSAVTCGKDTGFIKTSLLSAEKPARTELLRAARDAQRPADQRYESALRAFALDPSDSEARLLARRLFFDMEFASPAPRKNVPRLYKEASFPAKAPVDKTLAGHLGDALEMRGDRFVVAKVQDRYRLWVIRGHLSVAEASTPSFPTRNIWIDSDYETFSNPFVERLLTGAEPAFPVPLAEFAMLRDFVPRCWNPNSGASESALQWAPEIRYELNVAADGRSARFVEHLPDGSVVRNIRAFDVRTLITEDFQQVRQYTFQTDKGPVKLFRRLWWADHEVIDHWQTDLGQEPPTAFDTHANVAHAPSKCEPPF